MSRSCRHANSVFSNKSSFKRAKRGRVERITYSILSNKLQPANTILRRLEYRAGSANVEALFGKICGAIYPQDQNKMPNARVLLDICHIISMSIFVYSIACFRLVCSDMFPYFY